MGVRSRPGYRSAGGGLRRFGGAWTMRVVVADDVLRRYLSSLAREELVHRLLALAERDEAALTALRAEAAADAGTFDLAGFRKKLTARLRISGFEGGDYLSKCGDFRTGTASLRQSCGKSRPLLLRVGCYGQRSKAARQVGDRTTTSSSFGSAPSSRMTCASTS